MIYYLLNYGLYIIFNHLTNKLVVSHAKHNSIKLIKWTNKFHKSQNILVRLIENYF